MEPEDDDHYAAFVIPEGKVAGDILQVHLSDGRDIEVEVPDGFVSGDVGSHAISRCL